MTGKFSVFKLPSIILFLGRTLRSGKSYQPRSENELPQRKKQRKNLKTVNQKPSPNQPQPNPDQPHPSPKPKATQNPPVQSNKSPEPTFSQSHPQSSPTTRQSSPTSQTGITASDVKKLWTDLKDPISYSGDSAKIFNKIRSFQ